MWYSCECSGFLLPSLYPPPPPTLHPISIGLHKVYTTVLRVVQPFCARMLLSSSTRHRGLLALHRSPPQSARWLTMRLFSFTRVPVHGILKTGTLVATRGRHQSKECPPMRKYLRRWFPFVLLLLIATLGYAMRAKNATQTPCRPSPEICQPKPIPPCEFTCPDAEKK